MIVNRSIGGSHFRIKFKLSLTWLYIDGFVSKRSDRKYELTEVCSHEWLQKKKLMQCLNRAVFIGLLFKLKHAVWTSTKLNQLNAGQILPLRFWKNRCGHVYTTFLTNFSNDFFKTPFFINFCYLKVKLIDNDRHYARNLCLFSIFCNSYFRHTAL